MKICVLPGDGIGPEVTHAALPIFSALDIPADLIMAEIGWECWKKGGDPVPEATWSAIDTADAVLLGAITSKPQREAIKELPPHLKDKGHHYVSPVIQLRQKLNLFANVRPVEDLFHSENARFNFCVIRENTEGLYAGLDFSPLPESLIELILKEKGEGFRSRHDLEHASASIRLQTYVGLKRILHFAGHYALENGHHRVTLADKPNVLRKSGSFAREILEEVASDFPTLHFDIENADAVALRMVRRPESFGVIVAENMFGDVLSDLGAAVMGGLGLAPSGNIGLSKPYFEPVHGSAPKYVGQERANPIALFMSIALLLKNAHFKHEAHALVRACRLSLMDKKYCTPDVDGTATTLEAAHYIIHKAAALHKGTPSSS